MSTGAAGRIFDSAKKVRDRISDFKKVPTKKKVKNYCT